MDEVTLPSNYMKNIYPNTIQIIEHLDNKEDETPNYMQNMHSNSVSIQEYSDNEDDEQPVSQETTIS